MNKGFVKAISENNKIIERKERMRKREEEPLFSFLRPQSRKTTHKYKGRAQRKESRRCEKKETDKRIFCFFPNVLIPSEQSSECHQIFSSR